MKFPRPPEVDMLMRRTRLIRGEPLPYLEAIWCPLYDDRRVTTDDATLSYFQQGQRAQQGQLDGDCNVATIGHLPYAKGFVGQGMTLTSDKPLPRLFKAAFRIGEEDVIQLLMRGEHGTELHLPTPIYVIPPMQHFCPRLTVDAGLPMIGQRIRLILPGWLVRESQ